MLKKLAIGGLAALALSSPGKADLIIPNSGVWKDGPRAYEGSTVAPTPLKTENPYTFKLKLINDSPNPEDVNLSGQVIGVDPGVFYTSSFTMQPGADSTRGGLFGEFSQPGFYDVVFTANNETFSRTYEVTPEPSSLLLFASAATGIVALKRKRE